MHHDSNVTSGRVHILDMILRMPERVQGRGAGSERIIVIQIGYEPVSFKIPALLLEEHS